MVFFMARKYVTRKEKREKDNETDLLKEIVTIMRQYFPELTERFNLLTDARHQSYVEYEMKVIFIVRLVGLLISMKSMHEMTRTLNTEEAIKNIAQICKVELKEIPHCDTMNNVFEKINIEELEEVNKYLIQRIIASKMGEKYKIRRKYYHIIVDGTGLATSRVEYNKNCLVKNKTDKNGNNYQEYSTYVLEAKLVLGEMVFSIASEFVENIRRKVKGYQKIENQKLQMQKNKKITEKKTNKKNLSKNKFKQDCEIKAFKRLSKKIKTNYPRLKILISGDALYANKPVLEICKENGWKYIIRFKEGAIPTLYKEFNTVTRRLKDGNESNEKNKELKYEFASKLDYNDYKINILRYAENNKEKETEFVYITDLCLSNKNIIETVKIGRKRWKIENEGFNIQKNGIFDIGHLYSKNATAIKVHYILIQIAHMLRQLLEKGSASIKDDILFKRKTISEVSDMLKKTLTTQISNLEQLKHIQLRFVDQDYIDYIREQEKNQ